MVLNGNIVLAATVVEVVLAKAPVATTTNKAAAIDVERQRAVVLVECHLAHTHLERVFVRRFAIDLELKLRIIKIGITITLGPPEVEFLLLELGECVGAELNGALLARCKCYLLFERDCTDLSAQCTCYGCIVVVFDKYLGGKCCKLILALEGGLHEGIAQRYVASRSEIYIVVDTYVATSDRRDPVPAD